MEILEQTVLTEGSTIHPSFTEIAVPEAPHPLARGQQSVRGH